MNEQNVQRSKRVRDFPGWGMSTVPIKRETRFNTILRRTKEGIKSMLRNGNSENGKA